MIIKMGENTFFFRFYFLSNRTPLIFNELKQTQTHTSLMMSEREQKVYWFLMKLCEYIFFYIFLIMPKIRTYENMNFDNLNIDWFSIWKTQIYKNLDKFSNFISSKKNENISHFIYLSLYTLIIFNHFWRSILFNLFAAHEKMKLKTISLVIMLRNN